VSGKNLEDLIPGGSHTYSRGRDQFSSNTPGVFLRGRGANLWDEHGDKYLDFGMALRSVALGYSYKPVIKSAIQGARFGNNLTLPSVIERQAAETVISAIPSIEMVKFAKNGSNVVTAAVKLARAFTGKKLIAIAEDHPFFSFDDWFIGTTAMAKGVPVEHSALTLKFKFNQPDSLKRLFSEHPGEIAAVLMEPATGGQLPQIIHECGENLDQSCGCNQNFLQFAKALCERNGALLILDEMITGFRWGLPGAHSVYNVKPDLLTFGKAVANGFSVAFLGGRSEVMEIAGIRRLGEERVFLLSSTHGAEMSSLAAMISSMHAMQKYNVPRYMYEFGESLIAKFNGALRDFGLDSHMAIVGFPASPIIRFNGENAQHNQAMRTLFLQEMTKNKVLMPWLSFSLAHEPRHIAQTLKALDQSSGILSSGFLGDPLKLIHGPVTKPVFRKFN
jgi:glutamate-1-semialdehyde 2,1-aminomutase